MEGAHTQQSALKHDIVNKHSCFSFKHLLSLKKGKFALEGDDLIEENEVHEGDDFIEKNQVYNIEEIKECENSSNDVLIEEKDRESSSTPYGSEVEEKKELGSEAFEKQVSVLPEVEIEMMKARFAKLLLGEDMSGCGNGVPTALAISNAITNLCATIFGQLWRLEPLPPEKKAMWRREMEWLLCVSDHIVELKPTWQTFPNGTKLEVMTRRPRSDLFVNLPALCDLDNTLLEILDSFVNTKFRYVDQGVLSSNGDGSSPFHRQEEKWWLPVPQVPPCGLNESSRKHLQNKRDCANQISKAVMAINNTTLAEIEVPDTYLESLPKTARTSLGDVLYKYITSDTYSPESLLACLDISSEHQAIEIANRVEDSIYIWKKKTNSKLIDQTTKSSSRSWKMFKDLIAEGEKREMLIERAESILLSLKQHFPFLPQTTLDVSKIQSNKDIGKSILESYSRVLESLASNIVARIDDVLYVDDLTKHSGQFSSLSKVGAITHKSIPIPYRSSFGTANCVKSPFINSNELPQGGVGMNKLSRDFSSIGRKEEIFDEVLEFETERESNDRTEDFEIDLMDRAWLE